MRKLCPAIAASILLAAFLVYAPAPDGQGKADGQAKAKGKAGGKPVFEDKGPKPEGASGKRPSG